MTIKVNNMKLQGKSFIIILGALLLVTACNCKKEQDGDDAEPELTEKVKELVKREKDLLAELEPLQKEMMLEISPLKDFPLSDEDKKTIIDAAYKFEYTGSEPASFVSEWEKIKKLKNKANPIITAISSATCTIMAIAKKVLGVLQMTKDTMDQIGADTTQLNLGIAYLKKAIELYNNRIDLIAAFCEK